MEGLAPPLKCIIEIKHGLVNGHSLRWGLEKYISLNQDPFCLLVQQSVFYFDQGLGQDQIDQKGLSEYRRALLQLIWTGLENYPIFDKLEALEQEVKLGCQNEIDERLQILAIKILIPTLFLLLPAYLILLFSPILNQILKSY